MLENNPVCKVTCCLNFWCRPTWSTEGKRKLILFTHGTVQPDLAIVFGRSWQESSILLTWRPNAVVWTSGVAMVGKWGRFSSQRCLLIYYYQGVGGLGLGKILAKLNLPIKFVFVSETWFWRQSIVVVFSLAKPPGIKSFHT